MNKKKTKKILWAIGLFSIFAFSAINNVSAFLTVHLEDNCETINKGSYIGGNYEDTHSIDFEYWTFKSDGGYNEELSVNFDVPDQVYSGLNFIFDIEGTSSDSLTLMIFYKGIFGLKFFRIYELDAGSLMSQLIDDLPDSIIYSFSIYKSVKWWDGYNVQIDYVWLY
ncbi:MAG: hypothetical protein KGD63_04210 [Candidatus Lokiarchaeota archaeon]|nr:hypothetical protein [Candidatus Lokiarchaeota archaeon]